LRYNNISDLTPLSSLPQLEQLDLWGNQVIDTTPVANLAGLTRLNLFGNQIVDVSPLMHIASIVTLTLSNNEIVDIAPLLDNTGLGEGDVVFLQRNPLSDTSINTCIPQLEARGVYVVF